MSQSPVINVYKAFPIDEENYMCVTTLSAEAGTIRSPMLSGG